MLTRLTTSPPEARNDLNKEEYEKILTLLGREPNETELGMFSALWSEHCSYKSSKEHLKKLPTKGKRVLQGPGENAGAVDLGGGLAAVFKIESHNHPSAVEPYQGAATGVGGILRDIFTMGARPIALLDSLRFGPLDRPRARRLFQGVVAGIAGYGNCVGVPTVGGEVFFHEIYEKNPLVNVFCVGIARKKDLVRASASGAGNPVIYVGAKTGRDGIHGARFASEEFDESGEDLRPMVQVGDPFTEKLLLEACLDLVERGLCIGLQDMGAAGLSSSSSEMAHRGGTGMAIDLSAIPCREEGMTPYEVMLSESQERMLVVGRKGKEKEIQDVFKKWDLDAVVIGHVTADRLLRVRERGQVVAEVPVSALTEDAPVYKRPLSVPPYLDVLQSFDDDLVRQPADMGQVLLRLLSSPTIASKEWIYRQYDHMVRTNTLVLPGSDAAVLRIKGTESALSLSVDGAGAHCLLNPYIGAAMAVAEAARNVVCSGARPLALTNCLNFGNPERPPVMWQFALTVEGIADACKGLGLPVVSGNVSFYNDTQGVGIYPTPVIGMVGLIDDAEKHLTQWLKNDADLLVLLGETGEDIGGTEYLRVIHSLERGFPPQIDLRREARLQSCLLAAAEKGLLRSAHDLSEGGFAVALAESCISSQEDQKGAEVSLDLEGMRPDAFLFSETPSRVIVSVAEKSLDHFLRLCRKTNLPAAVIGKVGGKRLLIRTKEGKVLVDLPVGEMSKAWRTAIPAYFQ